MTGRPSFAQEGHSSSLDVVDAVSVGFVTTASVVETSGRIVIAGGSAAAVVMDVAAGLSDVVRPFIGVGISPVMAVSVACGR